MVFPGHDAGYVVLMMVQVAWSVFSSVITTELLDVSAFHSIPTEHLFACLQGIAVQVLLSRN